MHIIVKHVENLSLTRAREIASFISGYLETIDDGFSVSVHGNTVDECLEITEEWKLTDEELEDLEN